jgi:hypothetical protein
MRLALRRAKSSRVKGLRFLHKLRCALPKRHSYLANWPCS